MADERRPDGHLRDVVLRLLERARRPLTAASLTARIARDEGNITPSLVFRAIGQLLERGKIHRIVTARGYAAGDGTDEIGLLCDRCGTLTKLPGAHALAHLNSLCAAKGFSATTAFIEVQGLCRRCRRPGGASDESTAAPSNRRDGRRPAPKFSLFDRHAAGSKNNAG